MLPRIGSGALGSQLIHLYFLQVNDVGRKNYCSAAFRRLIAQPSVVMTNPMLEGGRYMKNNNQCSVSYSK